MLTALCCTFVNIHDFQKFVNPFLSILPESFTSAANAPRQRLRGRVPPPS